MDSSVDRRGTQGKPSSSLPTICSLEELTKKSGSLTTKNRSKTQLAVEGSKIMDFGNYDHTSQNNSTNQSREKSLPNDSMALDSNLVQKDGINSGENKQLYDLFYIKHPSTKKGSGHSNISGPNKDSTDKQMMSNDGSIVQLEATKKEAEKTDINTSKYQCKIDMLNQEDAENANNSAEKYSRDPNNKLPSEMDGTRSQPNYLKEKSEKSEVYSSENEFLSGTVINGSDAGETRPNIRTKNDSNENKNLVEGSSDSHVNFPKQERAESGNNSKNGDSTSELLSGTSKSTADDTAEALNERDKKSIVSDGSNRSQMNFLKQERAESDKNSRNGDSMSKLLPGAPNTAADGTTETLNERGENYFWPDGSFGSQMNSPRQERSESDKNSRNGDGSSGFKSNTVKNAMNNTAEAKNERGTNIKMSDGCISSQLKPSEQEPSESSKNSRNIEGRSASASNKVDVTAKNVKYTKNDYGGNSVATKESTMSQTDKTKVERRESGNNSGNDGNTKNSTAKKDGFSIDHSNQMENATNGNKINEDDDSRFQMNSAELEQMELEDESIFYDCGGSAVSSTNTNTNTDNKVDTSSDSDADMEDNDNDNANLGNPLLKRVVNKIAGGLTSIGNLVMNNELPNKKKFKSNNGSNEAMTSSALDPNEGNKMIEDETNKEEATVLGVQLNQEGSKYRDVDGQWYSTKHNRPGIGIGGLTSDYGDTELTEYQSSFSVKNKNNKSNTNNKNIANRSWNELDQIKETAYVKPARKQKSDNAQNPNNNYYSPISTDEEEDKDGDVVMQEGNTNTNNNSTNESLGESGETSIESSQTTDDGDAWNYVVDGKAHKLGKTKLTDSTSRHWSSRSYKDANKKFDGTSITQRGKSSLSKSSAISKFVGVSNVTAPVLNLHNNRTSRNLQKITSKKEKKALMQQHNNERANFNLEPIDEPNSETLTLKYKVGKKSRTQNKVKMSAVMEIMETMIKCSNNSMLIHSKYDPSKTISNHNQWLAAQKDMKPYYREYINDYNGGSSRTIKFQVTLKGHASAKRLKREVWSILTQHHIRLEGEFMSEDMKKAAWLLGAEPNYINPEPIEENINRLLADAKINGRVVVKRGNINQTYNKKEAMTQALVIHCRLGSYNEIKRWLADKEELAGHEVVLTYPYTNKSRKKTYLSVIKHEKKIKSIEAIELCNINEAMLTWEICGSGETLEEAIKEHVSVIGIEISPHNQHELLSVVFYKANIRAVHEELVKVLSNFEEYSLINHETAVETMYPEGWNPHVANHYMLDNLAMDASFARLKVDNDEVVTSKVSDSKSDGVEMEVESVTDTNASVESNASKATRTYASAASRRSRSRSRRKSKSKPIPAGVTNDVGSMGRSSSPDSTISYLSMAESIATLQEQCERMESDMKAQAEQHKLEMLRIQEQHKREMDNQARESTKQLNAMTSKFQETVNNNYQKLEASRQQERKVNLTNTRDLKNQNDELRQQNLQMNNQIQQMNARMEQMMQMMMVSFNVPVPQSISVPNQVGMPQVASLTADQSATTPQQHNRNAVDGEPRMPDIGRRNLNAAFDQSSNQPIAGDNDPSNKKRESQGGVSPLDSERKQLRSDGSNA